MAIKLASWNVNGIRAAVRNGLDTFVKNSDFDVLLLQEIKADESQIPEELENTGYGKSVFPAVRKGYSGVMALFKKEPVSVRNGMGEEGADSEGRTQILEYPEFFLLNTYFPNSQHGLTRLDYKIEFDEYFQEFCQNLRNEKPLVICGDFNVAHKEIDIARPKDNMNNAGFTDQERSWMTNFLEKGYLDTFRLFNEDGGHYTWWTYRFKARERNIGWRIDYFIVSEELRDKVSGAGIMSDVVGSDHAPIFIELDL